MSQPHSPSLRHALQSAAWSAATAWSFYLMAKFVNHRWHVLRLEAEVAKLQKLLEHERIERRAQRQGRIRAEQELRRQQLQAAANASGTWLGLQPGFDPGPEPEPGFAPGLDPDPGPGSDTPESEVPLRSGMESGSGLGAGRGGFAATTAGGLSAPGRGISDTHSSEQATARGQTAAASAARVGGAGAGEGQHGQGQGVVTCSDGALGSSASNGGTLHGARGGNSGRGSGGRGGGRGIRGAGSGAFTGGLVFPLHPIGTVRSCFSQRNGTPRQPLLVPLARCRVQLAPDVPAACLEGLEQYSHVWVLYLFHENTDLVKLWQGSRSGVKAKVHVPRLNGDKMGVLATRSPHRPVPIGLSVAQVISIEGNTITLGGADIVDGSPVLDIKPYLPFVDAVPQATAPSWVTEEAEDEPLHIAQVECSAAAANHILRCWSELYGPGRYSSTQSRSSKGLAEQSSIQGVNSSGLSSTQNALSTAGQAQGDASAGGKEQVGRQDNVQGRAVQGSTGQGDGSKPLTGADRASMPGCAEGVGVEDTDSKGTDGATMAGTDQAATSCSRQGTGNQRQAIQDKGHECTSSAGGLYRTGDEYLALVKQVLLRDIRPVHRRIQSPLWSDTPPLPPTFYPGPTTSPHAPLRIGSYHVVLEGIDVSYDINDKGTVVLRGAVRNVVQSQQRGLGLLSEA